MKENLLLEKTFAFAIRIVETYRSLVDDRREYVLAKQLLRSGTSIGANAEEAVGAQSRPDFISKLSIAYKEARETNYWLRLLLATGYLDVATANSLVADCDELLRIIGKIQITTKRNS
jgi:four helix bundle protein